MQQNGSSSLSTRAAAASGRKSSWGLRVMTFSGQVALHSPHCTQASSVNRSIGRSGSSPSAPVGQADTQARQSVQPPISISTAPKGAWSGSAIVSIGSDEARCSSRSASRIRLRFSPKGRKLAGRGAAAIDGRARKASLSRSGSSASMAETRPSPNPRAARIVFASTMLRRNPATSWRGRSRRRTRNADAP